eukprot:371362-Alexandrium_andersonii.AAC.1
MDLDGPDVEVAMVMMSSDEALAAFLISAQQQREPETLMTRLLTLVSPPQRSEVERLMREYHL